MSTLPLSSPASPRVYPVKRNLLFAAFVIQLVLVVACVTACLYIYKDFRTKTEAQINENARLFAVNKSLESALKVQSQQIQSDVRSIATWADQAAFVALQSKRYDYAIQAAKDGLQVAPNDPGLAWRLVQAQILNHQVEDALKTANALPLVAVPAVSKQQSDATIQRNLLTLGLASCAAHDDDNAIDAINRSGIAQTNKDEIQSFCSPAVRKAVAP